jgi:hypothetical protein
LAAYIGRHELVELVLGLGAELDLISAVVLGHTNAVKVFVVEQVSGRPMKPLSSQPRFF